MYYLADITMAYSQYSRPKVANEPPEDDQTGGSSASFSNWRTLINNTAPRKRNMGRVRTTAVRYFHLTSYKSLSKNNYLFKVDEKKIDFFFVLFGLDFSGEVRFPDLDLILISLIFNCKS